MVEAAVLQNSLAGDVPRLRALHGAAGYLIFLSHGFVGDTLDVSQYVGQKHLISRCPMHLGIVMIRCERCRSIKKEAPELVRRPLA